MIDDNFVQEGKAMRVTDALRELRGGDGDDDIDSWTDHDCGDPDCPYLRGDNVYAN